MIGASVMKGLIDFPGPFTKYFFTRNEHSYSFRTQEDVKIPQVNIALKGQNTIRHFGL